MVIFITQYEEDGKVFAGPYIVAENIADANKQAERFQVELVGELINMIPLEYFEEDRMVH
tara:strand:+ start:533 stop:712 length:180 start_codon:yes stop_codon:yes gene_type:complete